MTPIVLVAVGNPRRSLLDALAPALAREFGTSCSWNHLIIDPRHAYHSERGQYHSTAILEQLVRNANDRILLGVTEVDLFIPILTFVFGEAQLSGSSAIVSYCRLQQEFYGVPADDSLLVGRTIKESVHEVGHILGLSHCDDYACVMSPSHSVEAVDLKGASMCDHCKALHHSDAFLY